MKPQKRVKKNVEAKLKIWLLHGKSITHNNAQRMWGTNRLAEYIRRLRHDQGMNIKTEMKSFSDGIYAVYSLVKKEKKNRIQTREYLLAAEY